MEAVRNDAPRAQVASIPAVPKDLWPSAAAACAALQIATWRVIGSSRDDVDDAVYSVGAPDRGARAANDLDALDGVERNVLRIPENAGEDGRVDRAAVDQDEKLIGILTIEAACADGPFAGFDLGYINDPEPCAADREY